MDESRDDWNHETGEGLYPEDGDVFHDPNWEEDPPGSGVWQVRRDIRWRLAARQAERLLRRRMGDGDGVATPAHGTEAHQGDGDASYDWSRGGEPPDSAIWRVWLESSGGLRRDARDGSRTAGQTTEGGIRDR